MLSCRSQRRSIADCKRLNRYVICAMIVPMVIAAMMRCDGDHAAKSIVVPFWVPGTVRVASLAVVG